MVKSDDWLQQEVASLQQRLTRLSEASLRINETLDFDSVLQVVVDCACDLTDARYGGITVLSNEGSFEEFVASGLTPDERRLLVESPENVQLFWHLNGIDDPLRVDDLSGYMRSFGMEELRPPVAVTSLLMAPIRNAGIRVGSIYLTRREDGNGFTREDEETLLMFASQAALVIANARRYRDEQRARADLEALVNTSPVGVVVFDARTGIPVSHNRETLRIVEGLLDPDRPVEQIMDILSPRRMDGREISLEESPLAHRLSTGRTIRAEEIVLQVPGGRSVTVLVNATPLYSQDGTQMESVVVTLQDMTPLEELERLRAEFLAMVSHELRAPLTSIKGSAATLLDESAHLNPAELRQFHRIIDGQADRMRRMIADLLDVAHIETGALSVSPEPTDLATLAGQARNAFASERGSNELHIDFPASLPPVMADRHRVVQVLSNLLSNASRYSQEFSVIRLTAERQDWQVAVSVADEGRGVSTDQLQYLFRKYVRIEGDNGGSESAGTGLGLAICKGIIEANGGRIWAESDGPGLGARFTFTLQLADPAAPGEPAGRDRSSARSRPDPDEHARILAVDDDPQTLRLVRDALTKAGYTPILTADPDEALRLVETDRPQLVLLNLVLPDTDGIELMQDILDIAEVPVIFLTAYGRDQNLERAFDMGAADYMVKPFSPTELTARIRAALRKQAGLDHDESSEPFVLGDLSIDYLHRTVLVAGQAVHLTPIEYDLLRVLSANQAGS